MLDINSLRLTRLDHTNQIIADAQPGNNGGDPPLVYLPGIGWRGYDPMFGLAVADQHIAVAAASRSSLAAPTSGTFRGTESTTMTSDVPMNLLEATS